jgi:3-oxoacyl-[acyl-carrier protein] reductase
MINNLKNKTALVTGASRGLGAAIAIRLGAAGANVAINYLNRKKDAEKVREEILEGGGKAEIFQADVTDEDQIKILCESVVRHFSAIDILVVNATLVHVHKPIEELTWKDTLEHLEFFVKSPLLLAKQIVPSMKKKGFGRIINIGSEVFDRGLPEFSNYVAAKGAQVGLTRSWANELGKYQITVNLVAPGWIPTEMHKMDPEEMKAEYTKRVPLQRMGDPEDVAEMVTFLASDAGKFITGQRITVNGGITMV